MRHSTSQPLRRILLGVLSRVNAHALVRGLVARMPRHHSISASLSLAAGLLGSLTIAAQALGATPVGSEFQVNTFTTNDQRLPAVAVAADGDFVVVRHSGARSQRLRAWVSLPTCCVVWSSSPRVVASGVPSADGWL